jgi:hypothetical protein
MLRHQKLIDLLDQSTVILSGFSIDLTDNGFILTLSYLEELTIQSEQVSKGFKAIFSFEDTNSILEDVFILLRGKIEDQKI